MKRSLGLAWVAGRLRSLPRRLLPLPSVLFLLWGALLPSDRLHAASAANLLVANITDQSFLVTWTTENAVSGQVRLTTGQVSAESPYPDGRGPDFIGRTHFVLVRGLQPNQPYAFDLLSGSEVDGNGGAHYSVTTGPALPAPAGRDAFTGTVMNPDGSFAGDAFVLLRLQVAGPTGPVQSQWLAAPVAGDPAHYFGEWLLTLRVAPRTADLTSVFAYDRTNDHAALFARGATGSLGTTADLPALRDGNYVLNLAGPAVTATPTTLRPSATATRLPTRTASPQPSFTPIPTDTPDLPTRTASPTLPRATATALSATSAPALAPTAADEPDTETPEATRVAVAVPTSVPQPVETRAAATPADRLASPTVFLLLAVVAFGFAALFVLLAIYFWRRQS